MKNFYVIQLLEDVNDSTNKRTLHKGERLIAWEDDSLGVFWVANELNTMPIKYAQKILKVNFEEIEESNKFVNKVKKMFEKADKQVAISACGFDEGFYTGKSEAFEEVLELLKTQTL